MSSVQFVEKKIGMHRTVYEHPEFETIKGNFRQFAIVHQHKPDPTTIHDVTVQAAAGFIGYKTSLFPECSWGERLYGVNPDGSLFLLKKDVDSSD